MTILSFPLVDFSFFYFRNPLILGIFIVHRVSTDFRLFQINGE